MVAVYKSTIINAPIDELWAFLRDFNAHDQWHPAIDKSMIEAEKQSTQIGAVRNFNLVSGEKLREQLISMSDADYSYTYTIVDSEVPLFHYVAKVQLRPVSGENKTFWSWSSEFETPLGQEKELSEVVGEGVYTAGFEATRKIIEAK